MRPPRFVRVLLYKVGWDSCDPCGFRFVRRDGWFGKGWELWGPFLHCPKCNAEMNASYDAMMRREMSKWDSRQSPI